MKKNEYLMSRSFFDLGTVHSDLFFSETSRSFETKDHKIAYRKMGIKVYTNEPGHITNLAAISIYNKNLLKIFFSRIN